MNIFLKPFNDSAKRLKQGSGFLHKEEHTKHCSIRVVLFAWLVLFFALKEKAEKNEFISTPGTAPTLLT